MMHRTVHRGGEGAAGSNSRGLLTATADVDGAEDYIYPGGDGGGVAAKMAPSIRFRFAACIELAAYRNRQFNELFLPLSALTHTPAPLRFSWSPFGVGPVSRSQLTQHTQPRDCVLHFGGTGHNLVEILSPVQCSPLRPSLFRPLSLDCRNVGSVYRIQASLNFAFTPGSIPSLPTATSRSWGQGEKRKGI